MTPTEKFLLKNAFLHAGEYTPNATAASHEGKPYTFAQAAAEIRGNTRLGDHLVGQYKIKADCAGLPVATVATTIVEEAQTTMLGKKAADAWATVIDGTRSLHNALDRLEDVRNPRRRPQP